MGAALGVLAFLLVLGGYDTTNAGTFNPQLDVTLTSTEPETATEFTVDIKIAEGDVNFGGFLAFIPPDWGIVRGDEIPIGEPVGDLTAVAILGLANNACFSKIDVNFQFQNATLNQDNLVDFDDLDELGDPGFGDRDFAEDKDGNTMLDAIDHYPDFLTRVFKGLQPIRRSAGITPVAGIPILLQFLVFEPGTVFDLPGEEFEKLIPKDPKVGYPTVTVLQAIGDEEIVPEPSVINDFCTPLVSTNNTFASAMDADNDGVANIDDPCPYEDIIPNAEDANGNDVPDGNDIDFDFLDSSCDPNDDETVEDQDGDGVDNEDDNCPLDENPAPAGAPDADEDDKPDQDDEDADDIGDACDKNPGERDGYIDLYVTPKDGKHTFTVLSAGQRDADDDSYENSLDTCPLAPNTGNPRENISGDGDGDGLDVACDPNDDPAAGGGNSDEDGDGYANRQDNCPLKPNGQDLDNQEDDDFDQIGNACDTDPLPNGALVPVTNTIDVSIGTGSGAGGPPSEEKCANCYRSGDDPFKGCHKGQAGTECADADEDTGEPSDTGGPTTKPTDEVKDGEDGGSNVGIIVAAVIAAIVVLGGGAFFVMRRRGA